MHWQSCTGGAPGSASWAPTHAPVRGATGRTPPGSPPPRSGLPRCAPDAVRDRPGSVMAALRLVRARHGQTTANAEGILDTRLPGHPLTEEGHRQAAELADRLADEPVVAVYASRALRAQQTAKPIAARHGLAAQVLGGVHEVFIGDLEGRQQPEDH